MNDIAGLKFNAHQGNAMIAPRTAAFIRDLGLGLVIILRQLKTNTRELFDAAVAQAMNAISLDNLQAWTAFAGYRLA